MSIIVMAVYSTEENKKDEYLDKTLQSLKDTVDFTKHRLVLSVNGFTPITRLIFKKYEDIIETIIYNETNLGTAEAINKGWRLRKKGEHAIKIDDDVVIYEKGWADLMEECISVNPRIGQIGLKRPDLIESPDNPNEFYRSELFKERLMWCEIELEKCHHIMGTCVMHSDRLLNEVGYLWQPSLYGLDDAYMSLRSELNGFINCFIPKIKIEHIDTGATPYQKWKESEAMYYLREDIVSPFNSEKHKISKGDIISRYMLIVLEYEDGKDVYYNPFL